MNSEHDLLRNLVEATHVAQDDSIATKGDIEALMPGVKSERMLTKLLLERLAWYADTAKSVLQREDRLLNRIDVLKEQITYEQTRADDFERKVVLFYHEIIPKLQDAGCLPLDFGLPNIKVH